MTQTDQAGATARSRAEETLDAVRVSRRESLLAAACGVIALLLWAVSLPMFRLDPDTMNGFGLLQRAPVPWFAAAALGAAAYLAFAVRGLARGWALCVLHAAVTAVLFGTTAILYDWPRYSWVYKHIGVTDYLLAGHSLDRTLDIYQNWPGFFLLAAGVAKVTTLDAMTMARFAEPVFGALYGACVYYAVGALTRDRRVRWSAAAIYLLANWIGQGYFAPQALGLALQMLFLGAILRACITCEPRRWLAALTRRLRLTLWEREAVRDGRPIDLVVAVGSFGLLVATHQLTPVATLLQMAALWACFRVRHAWVLWLAPLMEAGWIASSWGFLSKMQLLNFDPQSNVAPPKADGVPSIPWLAFTQWGARVTTAAIAVLAIAGIVRDLRHRRLDPATLVLAFAPGLVFLANSYGAEGVMRVYVYALPWLAVFGAVALLRDRDWDGAGAGHGVNTPARARRRRLSTVLAVVAALGIFGPSLVASFGAERARYFSAEDVHTSQWFETHTPEGSYAVYVTANFPARTTSEYSTHVNPDVGYTPDVVSNVDLGGSADDAMTAAEKALTVSHPDHAYLVFSPSQKRYVDMWGQLAPGAYDEFQKKVGASRDYQLVHTDGAARVFKYVGSRQ